MVRATTGRLLAGGYGLSPLLAIVLGLGVSWTRRRTLSRRRYARLRFRCIVALVLAGAMVLAPAVAEAAWAGALAPPPPRAAGSPTTFTYTYDDDGNTRTRSDGVGMDTYAYDFENHMTRAVVGIGTPGTIDFAYDADGLRVARTAAGTTTTFLFDRNRDLAQVLVERTGAAAVTYTYGDDLIAMTQPGIGARYYAFDGQASTRQLTSAAGAVTDTYTYDAFGDLLAATGGTPNAHLFDGQALDANTGFYYLRARWYAHATGRFTTADPADGDTFDPGSLHRYLYAKADPVNNHDPTGLWNILQVSIAVGLIAGLAKYLVVLVKGGTLFDAIRGFVVVGLIAFAFTYALLGLANVAFGGAVETFFETTFTQWLGGTSIAAEVTEEVGTVIKEVFEQAIKMVGGRTELFDAVGKVARLISQSKRLREVCVALRAWSWRSGATYFGQIWGDGTIKACAMILGDAIGLACRGIGV
jgi:RHS repeat-associated protein